jgi:uncharacterized protein YcfJ
MMEKSMNAFLRTALAAAGTALATQAAAQVLLYENDNFGGRTFTAERKVNNFEQTGFNDRASSVVVLSDRWEICEHARFGGQCLILRPGRYPSLRSMGMNDRISSVRPVSSNARVEDNRYAPVPIPVYDNHPRKNEKLYRANVTSVHAVVGPPEERCWVEHEQVSQGDSGANIPGAVVGALIGGVLGHQVGGGHGQDIATAGGAVAGAYVGSNVGRNGGQQARTQDVTRCASVPNQGPPDYWDVTYNFRGLEHRMQMTSPPGTTVTVNSQGEPRA